MITYVTIAIVSLLFITVQPGATSAQVINVGANVNITRTAGNQAEGTIAINPNNTQQLFFASNPGATARRSTDGGNTWVAAGAGIGASCCDNVASWDTFGNLFLVNINAALTAVVLYLSTDGGANFTVLQTIDTGSIDQPSVKAGAGSVWVTWNDGTIKARGAAVTGLGVVGAFTAEQAAPNANTVSGQFGDIAIGPTGEVAVAYQSDTNIYVNVDTDGLGAGAFGAQVLVTSTNVAKFDFIPAQSSRSVDAEANLAWDRSGGPHNGRLYLVYTDENPDESNDTDVFVRFSDNNGATWSARVRVNDDATTRSQFLPNISIDQTTGNVAVTWHDARNDPGNNNAQFFGAVSTNGGVSFGANFQISAGTSNDDTAASGVDYGDYTSSDFHAGLLHVVWADNSNSTGDNPDGANSRFDMYTARIAVDDQAPTANAGPDQTVECAVAGTPVTLNGTGSSDPDNDPLTFTWTGSFGTASGATPTVTLPFGVHIITLTVDDGNGGTSTDTVTITVQDTTKPAIICPANQIVECTGPTGAAVAFAPTVSDTCSPVVLASCVPPSGSTFPLGTSADTCTAVDTHGNTNSCGFQITVQDTMPPSITSVTASPSSLWPPDHKMVPVKMAVSATDVCHPTLSCQITSVSSNEPVNGLGDGNTSPDWNITGSLALDLRAERAGTGRGRVYTIAVTCTDGSGNSSTKTTGVTVPHSRGN
jgi:HYR domain-containing protein/PKD domain-containing protein